MTKLNDARSVRSQRALQESLLRLMRARPFQDVTLRDIALEAGVSAPTFYRHYDTREALLADIAAGEISGLMALPFEPGRPDAHPSPGERICAFVEARRELWTTLLGAGAAPVMRETLIREGRTAAERGPRLNPRFPAEVMAGLVASGLFEIVAWWLVRAPSYPRSEVAAMLDALVIRPAIYPPQP